jgi:hypothetical protein
LVDAALRNGGRDNVTVVVVDALEGDEPPAPDADLEIDLSWDEDDATTDRLVDAEPDTPPTSGDTAPLPVIARSRPPRLTRGVVLFGVALVVIVAATVALLMMVGGDDEAPAPTTVPATTEPATTVPETTPPSTTIDLSQIFPTTTIKG